MKKGKKKKFTDSEKKKGTTTIAALYAAHSNNAANTFAGVNIENPDAVVCDAVAAGILDSLSAKWYAIKLAVDAAVTVLKVDQIIMSRP